MISFKSFVTAIHDAIIMANHTFMEKNVGIVDEYFMETTNEEDLQSSLDEALRISRELTAKKGNITREDLKSASSAFEKAKNALKPGDEEGQSGSATIPGTLSPKTVVLEYPRQTDRGFEYCEVHVPLITLVPLSLAQIEKATLSANFEMEIVNDELQLNFRKRSIGKRSKSRYGKLEITISPAEPAEGLKTIVEGYENALKSQIPH